LGEKQEENKKEVDQDLIDARIDCSEDILKNCIFEDEDSTKLTSMPRFEEIFQNFDANVQEKTEEFQS
jgi:hypothetical protein